MFVLDLRGSFLGYDGGSSDSAQDCAWLLELERSRDKLPNFWIILRVEGDLVYVYFHCRYVHHLVLSALKI